MGDSLDPVDLDTVSATGLTRTAKKAVAGTKFACVLTDDVKVSILLLFLLLLLVVVVLSWLLVCLLLMLPSLAVFEVNAYRHTIGTALDPRSRATPSHAVYGTTRRPTKDSCNLLRLFERLLVDAAEACHRGFLTP